jgi:hypothetical protein
MRGRISIAVAVLAATALASLATSARTNGSPAKDTVLWDAKASNELAAALHHMHEVANAGDTTTLKQLVIGDDALVTFELAPDNLTPVPLRSKQELYAHIDRVNEGVSTQGILTLDMPKMNCRATTTFGICTEECTVRLTMPDGTQRVDHLFGTGTAIKTDGAWRWVQWHMSVGGQPQIVKDGKVAAVDTSHAH